MYSDGLVEAHDPDRDMFGNDRVIARLATGVVAQDLIDDLVTQLDRFTGDESEQEDDITLVALERSAHAGQFTVLDEFTVESKPGNERQAIDGWRRRWPTCRSHRRGWSGSRPRPARPP